MDSKKVQPWRLWVGGAVLCTIFLGWQLEQVGAQREPESVTICMRFMFSPTEVWTVGSFSAIYHSKDGGKQWTKARWQDHRDALWRTVCH